MSLRDPGRRRDPPHGPVHHRLQTQISAQRAVVLPPPIPLASPGRGQDVIADRGPLQGVADAFGDVLLWLPVQEAHRVIDAGETPATSPGRRPARVLGWQVCYLVERAQEFPDCGARTGAGVDGGHRPGQGVEPAQRGDVAVARSQTWM